MAGMTVDKLRGALVSKEGIRTAIEEMGVECGQDVPFSKYREKILSIQTGSGELTYGAVNPGGRIQGTELPVVAVGKFVEITVE